ncbi:MAG: PQQ-like beta-propeller repeat protein [Kiritimatiellae bacterium]|nr:PQQ-like beta-propeller repeat protein [Kiritimatiellia bacterium]
MRCGCIEETHRQRRVPGRRWPCLLLVSFLLLPAALGDDWPQWRGPNRDGISAETGWLDNWDPTNAWSTTIGAGYSSIAITNGRAYTMGNVSGGDIVYCFNADTGAVIWTNGYTCTAGGSYSGPQATPTVDGDVVYTYSRVGYLYCWNAETGEKIWNKTVDYGQPGYDLSSSPLVEGNLIVVNTGSHGVAVDKRSPYTNVWTSSGTPGYASAIAFDWNSLRHVVIFANAGLYGLNPTTGATRWSYSFPHTYPGADPVKYGDQIFITTGYDEGRSILVNLGSGTLSHAWLNSNLKSHFSSCILQGQYLYGFNGQQGNGTLTCIDLNNSGAVQWTGIGSGGSAIAADGRLIVLRERGELGLVTWSPSSYNLETAWYDTGSGTDWWGPPAMANGKIYARSHAGTLVCVRIASLGTPEIAVSTTNINVSCETNRNAASVTFEVWNSGEGTLVYTATNNGSSKFQVSPSTGSSTGPADKQVHTITWTTAGMSEGDQERTATVADNGSGASNGPIDIHLGISVRPGVLDVRVAGVDDDAEESVSDHSVWTDSSDLELIRDGTTDQLVAMRFLNVTIPKGATISNTFVQFKVDETASESTSLAIRGEKTPDAATFNSNETANISSRAATDAFASWSPAAWDTVGSAGQDQQTEDLSALIQEIVDQAGWVSGNALALRISGSGRRTAESYNGDAAGAPLLHVEFTGGAQDDDGDAMADSWESTYFGGTNQTDCGPAEDKDSDGCCNLAEYIMGSDPTNAADSFQMQIVWTNGQIVVRHNTAAATGVDYDGLDRYYTIETAAAVTGAWSDVSGYTNILGNNDPVAFTNASPGGTGIFYQVRIKLQ